MYKILDNNFVSPVILDNRRFKTRTLENRLAQSSTYMRENYEPRHDTSGSHEMSLGSHEMTLGSHEMSLGSHEMCSDVDGEKNICGGGKNLFPIMDPRFNLREMAGNMILLEDHLFHEGKRCEDCIKKHAMTIDFLGSEAITLDKERKYTEDISRSNSDFRQFFKELAGKIDQGTLTDEDCCRLAQQLRKIRKPLCQKYATFIK
jgi:hypothetical protein